MSWNVAESALVTSPFSSAQGDCQCLGEHLRPRKTFPVISTSFGEVCIVAFFRAYPRCSALWPRKQPLRLHLVWFKYKGLVNGNLLTFDATSASS